jgi:hypothetical protein
MQELEKMYEHGGGFLKCKICFCLFLSDEQHHPLNKWQKYEEKSRRDKCRALASKALQRASIWF